MMRLDSKALQFMWKQTVWGTVLTGVVFVGLIVYFLTLPIPDYDAAKFVLVLLLVLPAFFGASYFVKRFIERMAD